MASTGAAQASLVSSHQWFVRGPVTPGVRRLLGVSVKVVRLSSWRDIQEAHGKLAERDERLLFRGQSVSTWPLSTSIERLGRRFGLSGVEMEERERFLLREFQRHYHRYSAHSPDRDDRLRWMSLMQHHGAPTRALDFTYSFWIAVFFAVEEFEPDCVAAVWTVSVAALSRVVRAEVPDLFAELQEDPTGGKAPELAARLLKSEKRVVVPVSPLAQDERLAIQQGIHLVPLSLLAPMQELVDGTIPDGVEKYEIALDLDGLVEALGGLQRMNIDRRVLFPDLDGLAGGLRQRIALRHLFPPDGYWGDV
jgi:FRG domain